MDCLDSPILSVRFHEYEDVDVSDYHRLKCRPPKVGDKYIQGSFAETKLFKLMQKEVRITVVRANNVSLFEEEYHAGIKDGRYKAKLKEPLKRGDVLYVDALGDTVIQFKWKKDGSVRNIVYSYSFNQLRYKTKTYRASNNDNLKLIKLSTGMLDKKFGKYTFYYNVNVGAKKKSITIFPKKQSKKAKLQIKVGTKGKYKVLKSIKVKLKKGQSKKIYIRVSAQDGVCKRTYVVKVMRKS
jgi:hypothetical protein